MKTTKLYQQDRYLKEWDARIVNVIDAYDESLAAANEEKPLILILDDTAFFPEGGGQSCDLGMIGPYKVLDVQENEDVVYHTVSTSLDQTTAPTPGDTVHCVLDWDRRFDNMQRHCGEHILSGIFYSMFGGINRGFHMGQDYMTVDISPEEDPKITEITDEDVLAAELAANKVIWSDAPVTVMSFDSREEAEKMPLRKALALDEDITIVSVGAIDNAADCVACCGTHPSTAGQVGLIKIFKVEKYKGMFRIYFEAGQRALQDYDNKHAMLSKLSNRYSSSIEDFPAKLRAQEEKLTEGKNELFQIKKAFMEDRWVELDALLDGSDPAKIDAAIVASDNVITYPVKQLSLDDVFNMAKPYMGKCKKLLMLYSIQATSYLLVSDGTIDCGSLVKEYASFYRGKGGGNKVSARAIFDSEENAMLFADLIRKHLQ